MLISKILTIRILFLSIRIPKMSIKIPGTSINWRVCQNEVTNPLGKGRLGGVDCEFACAHAMIAKQTFILHFRHFQHQSLVLEVSEVRVVFLLHKSASFWHFGHQILSKSIVDSEKCRNFAGKNR